MVQTPTARRWAALLDEAARSGMTMRAFAETRHVKPGTLAWWKWRLRLARSTPTEQRFFEVQAPVGNPVVLEVRDGAAYITVGGDTDLELVRRLVEALS